MVVLAAPDWDEEAIQEAEYQARQLESYDPDAAGDMRAMAAAARRKLTGQPISGRTNEPYDPMRLYARMAKFYSWSHSEMEKMHFVTFFAYVREASEINAEEEAEIERKRHGQGTNPGQVQGIFPEAERYEGETVAI